MAIDFPDSPSTNDTYTVNGRTYIWNGEKWLRAQPELTSVVPTLTVSNDFTVDTDTLVVDSTNNRVGIGTASPAAPLHLYHPTVNFPLVLESGDATAGIAFADSDSTGGYYNRTIQAVGDDIRINAGGSSRLTVDSSGNVGINDTTPSYKLDVNGDARVTGSFYLTGLATAAVGEIYTYTPVIQTNSAIGNGTVTGYYQRIGDFVHAHARFDFGSTSSWDNRFGRISAPQTGNTTESMAISKIDIYDSSAGLNYQGNAFLADNGANFRISGWRTMNANSGAGLTSGYYFDLNNDVTLSTGDRIVINCVYRAA